MISYSNNKALRGDLRFVKTSYVDKDTDKILREISILENFDGSFWNKVSSHDLVLKMSEEDFNKYYNT